MKHALHVILFVCLNFALSYEAHTASTIKNETFWKSIYEDHHVLDIKISITQKNWQEMQPTRQASRFGQPNSRSKSNFKYVKADILLDGTSFQDAGLRFKGNSSYQSAERGFKRPFKIDTNRFVKAQKLYGRTKFNLSNAFLDSSYVKERLGYELYHAAGLPTPGVGWANITLSIEGQETMNLGVYVLIEQVDDSFIEHHFGKKSKGSLLMKPELDADWKYPGNNDIHSYKSFEIKEGAQNADQITRFGQFLKAIDATSNDAFLKSWTNSWI